MTASAAQSRNAIAGQRTAAGTRDWDGEPVNAEPRKHAQVAWFTADTIPAKLVPDRREALLGYLRSPGEPVVSTDGFLPGGPAERASLIRHPVSALPTTGRAA